MFSEPTHLVRRGLLVSPGLFMSALPANALVGFSAQGCDRSVRDRSAVEISTLAPERRPAGDVLGGNPCQLFRMDNFNYPRFVMIEFAAASRLIVFHN